VDSAYGDMLGHSREVIRAPPASPTPSSQTWEIRAQAGSAQQDGKGNTTLFLWMRRGPGRRSAALPGGGAPTKPSPLGPEARHRKVPPDQGRLSLMRRPTHQPTGRLPPSGPGVEREAVRGSCH